MPLSEKSDDGCPRLPAPVAFLYLPLFFPKNALATSRRNKLRFRFRLACLVSTTEEKQPDRSEFRFRFRFSPLIIKKLSFFFNGILFVSAPAGKRPVLPSDRFAGKGYSGLLFILSLLFSCFCDNKTAGFPFRLHSYKLKKRLLRNDSI